MNGKEKALEILGREDTTAAARLEAVLKGDLIPAPVMREFACRVAERALAHAKDPDPASVNAIEVARRHARGKATDAELAAARKAAWAVYATARDAACTTARDAAYNAAWDAARAVTWDVAGGAAWDAEREAQVKILIALLREAEER